MTNQSPTTTTTSRAVRFASEAPTMIPHTSSSNSTSTSNQQPEIGSSSSSTTKGSNGFWVDLTPLHQQIKLDVKACKQACPEAADLHTLFDCPVKERIAFLVRLHSASSSNNAPVRGLERHVCKKHKVQRQCIKKGSILAVLNLQKKQRGLVDTDADADQLAEELRQVSEQHSRNARVFARLLALADEQVLRDEQDQDNIRQPRSKSDSAAIMSSSSSSAAAGNRLAQMQQQTTTTSSTTNNKAVETVLPTPVVAVTALPLPPPVEDCDRHQTASTAA